MNNEERAFDIMAAAEQNAEQLNWMIRQVPSHIKTALADEWNKSPWVSELPKAEARMADAVEEALDAIQLLRRTTFWAVWWVTGVTIALPIIIWMVKELNISGLW